MGAFTQKREGVLNVVKIPDGAGRLDFVDGSMMGIRESALKPGSYSGITQHELRHALINKNVIDGAGGADTVWGAVVRKPIHANSMYVRNGYNTFAGADEIIAVIGDSYKTGMTKQSFISSLIKNVDVEAVAGSNQISYTGMSSWTEKEATAVADLFGKWFNVRGW